jgi:hypothetical protein
MANSFSCRRKETRLKFLVTIQEETLRGVGTGCFGHMNIPDELALSPRFEPLCKAVESELAGLIVDMLREIQAV